MEAKLRDKTEIPLLRNSTELNHGRRSESDAAHYIRRAVSIRGDLAAKVNESADQVHFVSAEGKC